MNHPYRRILMKNRTRSRRAPDGAHRVQSGGTDQPRGLVKRKRSAKALGPRKPEGEVWVIDRTQCDVSAIDGAQEGPTNARHPWVTILASETTREVLDVWVTSWMPSPKATLRFIEATVKKFGRPAVLRTDNGSEWAAVARSLAADNIEYVPGLPYGPDARGYVERYFRKIRDSVMKTGRKGKS